MPARAPASSSLSRAARARASRRRRSSSPQWLQGLGHEVVLTFEPGATDVGRRLRAVLLDHHDAAGLAHPVLSPRAEALLFAADRAEHVASVVVPALERGAVVLCDRYIDSSVAYQGAGRDLSPGDVARVSRWATEGLLPDLTVVLDLPPGVGLGRVVTPDKLESEPQEFHERVRDRFLEQARRGGARYLVVDAIVTDRDNRRIGPRAAGAAAAPHRGTAARDRAATRRRGGRAAARRGGAGPSGGGRGRGAHAT